MILPMAEIIRGCVGQVGSLLIASHSTDPEIVRVFTLLSDLPKCVDISYFLWTPPCSLSLGQSMSIINPLFLLKEVQIIFLRQRWKLNCLLEFHFGNFWKCLLFLIQMTSTVLLSLCEIKNYQKFQKSHAEKGFQ